MTGPEATGGERELAVGSVFAGYRIEERLGGGGMGAVYRVRDLALDSERALKVLDPALARDRGFRERFQRESRLAAAIDDPAILPVYRAGEEDGRLFIAMRLVQGPDLYRLVSKDGPLEPQRTARIATAVAGALDAAHARGIVHRDVKPANILVELGPEGERVFVCDFGISRPSRPTGAITSTGELLGTADYISPEQINGELADARADVYALGCVVSYLLTGEPPFGRETELATLYAHANAERPRPSLLEPGLPPAIDEVVMRATAVEPEQRYASAGELAADLTRAVRAPRASSAAGVGADAPTTALERPPRGWLPLAAGVAALAALALVALGVVLIVGDDDEPGGAGAPSASAVETIGIGDSVSAIAVGKVNVLTVAEAGSALYAIDPAAGVVTRGPVEVPRPSSVAVGFGSVWVTSAGEDVLLRYGPPHRNRPTRIAVGEHPTDIAVDERWVWVANRDEGTVSRVDPYALTENARVAVEGRPSAIAAGEEAVWTVSPETGSLNRLARSAKQRTLRTTELGGEPTDLALGEGALWVVDGGAGTLTELGRVSAEPRGEPIEIGGAPVAVAAGLGTVWVAESRTQTLTGIDPESRSPVLEQTVGKRPVALSIGTDSVWVANAGGGNVTRVTP